MVRAASPTPSSFHPQLERQIFSRCTHPTLDDPSPSPPPDPPPGTKPTHQSSNSPSSAPAFRRSPHPKPKDAHACHPYRQPSRHPYLSLSSLPPPSSHPAPGTQSTSHPATTQTP